MISYINPVEVVKSKEFIREPVDNKSNEILNSSSKKIIISGGRGVGKTILLHNLEDRGLGTNRQTIYTHFDSVTNGVLNPDSIFGSVFFEHYYELIFSLKLLEYINNNYTMIGNYFIDTYIFLIKLIKETDKYINNAYYKEVPLEKYLTYGEVSTEIIKKLKEYLHIDELNIAMDRFDWTNGGSLYSQELLSRYFSMFDKSIITTDDDAIDELRKEERQSKGYTFSEILYNKDIVFIKSIIKRRVKLYNFLDDPKKFDINVLTEEIYQKLVSSFGGNIQSMLNAFANGAESLIWDSNGNVDEKFDFAIESELTRVRNLRSIQQKPRLYL